jgi:hypothetical protein
VFEKDIDDMSWVATNSIQMPMNDTPSPSHKKDKMPINAVTGVGTQPFFHPRNIASRVFEKDFDDMSWVATNSIQMPMNG